MWSNGSHPFELEAMDSSFEIKLHAKRKPAQQEERFLPLFLLAMVVFCFQGIFSLGEYSLLPAV